MAEKSYKSGFATLIGRPNVGKSTLMNHLIGQKIAITSNKPQTTRNRIQTVYTDEKGQIVFLDTPGIHKAKNKLGEYMVNVAERTLNEVDVILWLVEPSTFIGAGERHIVDQLKKTKTPVILIINKIDTVSSKFLNTKLSFLGAVLQDKSASMAVIEQKPLIQAYPGAAATKGIHQLVTRLNDEQTEEYKKKEGIARVFIDFFRSRKRIR